MKDDKFVTNTITLKDASIFCRNFLGVKSEKNSSGSRSFLVEIPEEIVDDLLDDDWNVKRSKRDNEDGTPSYYMKFHTRMRSLSLQFTEFFRNLRFEFFLQRILLELLILMIFSRLILLSDLETGSIWGIITE